MCGGTSGAWVSKHNFMVRGRVACCVAVTRFDIGCGRRLDALGQQLAATFNTSPACAVNRSSLLVLLLVGALQSSCLCCESFQPRCTAIKISYAPAQTCWCDLRSLPPTQVIDLSAGPTRYGPLTGVRSHDTANELPRLQVWWALVHSYVHVQTFMHVHQC
jgi:hypothetical protein